MPKGKRKTTGDRRVADAREIARMLGRHSGQDRSLVLELAQTFIRAQADPIEKPPATRAPVKKVKLAAAVKTALSPVPGLTNLKAPPAKKKTSLSGDDLSKV